MSHFNRMAMLIQCGSKWTSRQTWPNGCWNFNVVTTLHHYCCTAWEGNLAQRRVKIDKRLKSQSGLVQAQENGEVTPKHWQFNSDTTWHTIEFSAGIYGSFEHCPTLNPPFARRCGQQCSMAMLQIFLRSSLLNEYCLCWMSIDLSALLITVEEPPPHLALILPI